MGDKGFIDDLNGKCVLVRICKAQSGALSITISDVVARTPAAIAEQSEATAWAFVETGFPQTVEVPEMYLNMARPIISKFIK